MRERINDALKSAMKAGDKRRISTLRLVNSALKDKDIAARPSGRQHIGDDELIDMLAKMVKQREESEKIYADAGRDELAQAEAEEIAIIREFMPTQLSEEESKAAVAEIVAELGASSMKDMGRVMAALKERYAGKLDFAKAGQIVKDRLKQSHV